MIIGLCSKAPQAGKDCAARFLFKHGFVRAAFGDSIKEYCKVHYGWDGRKNVRGRELLTTIAMKIRNEVDQLYWIKRTGPVIDRLIKEEKPVVITDVRMLAEEKYLRENFNNFYLVEIKRDNVTKGRDAPTQVEIVQMNIDYVLDNNGTMDELSNNVEKMLKYFGGSD